MKIECKVEELGKFLYLASAARAMKAAADDWARNEDNDLDEPDELDGKDEPVEDGSIDHWEKTSREELLYALKCQRGKIDELRDEVHNLRTGYPVPCMKELEGNWLPDQMRKIGEEYNEVQEAYNAFNTADIDDHELANGYKIQLMEELSDLKTACETMQAALGASNCERRMVQRRVNAKNKERGYY